MPGALQNFFSIKNMDFTIFNQPIVAFIM